MDRTEKHKNHVKDRKGTCFRGRVMDRDRTPQKSNEDQAKEGTWLL